MSKSKVQNNFEKISKCKEKFQNLSSEIIASRLVNFGKANDISMAYKQILKERGIDDYLSVISSSQNK